MLKKTKILIVDDYLENIKALSELIAAPDVDVHSALNADQALEAIANHEFGLLLLDVQMPGTTGFELAEIIRGVARYRSLPIIFVTAHREDSSVIFDGYKTGAVDLLFKPLDANVVRAKVRMFVELAVQKELLRTQVAELEKLRKEADAANVAKTQFLANMSHEIRTPLAAVMGFSELIAQRHPEDQESQKLSSGIGRNGKLLMRLIDEILDFSKIEAHRIELEKIDFSLSELLEEVQSTLQFRAQEKGLNLIFVGSENVQHRYVADPSRIKQILLNVVGNAIKFTLAGTVRVEVSVHADSDSAADRFHVRVKDEGIGLSSQEAEKLFQPFAQADPSTRRHFGGSGLGLVISRQLARAMHGEVELVESLQGRGSVFAIDIKLEKSHVHVHAAPVRARSAILPQNTFKLSGKKILAVDDAPDNLTLIEKFLEGSEADVECVENGSCAIEKVKADDFDLILMDVQMPGMDGHETTERIRKMGFKKPIVALTAHAIRAEHDRCRSAGCDSVLTKPITRTALIAELQSQLP